MIQDASFWAPWFKPSAGFDMLQWSLLLAVAALSGYLLQRHLRMPKVLGYAAVGTVAGLLGFGSTPWPLQGPALFALELGVAIILFECGGRITLRWFRHNPMVLVQSVAEAALAYAAVFGILRWLGMPAATATPLALIAMASSPVVLTRVIHDSKAVGPVTDRAMVLATLSTLYALTLGTAKAEVFARDSASLWQDMTPVLVVLGVSIAVAALLCLAMRLALQLMSPTSENTSILMLALIAAASAVAARLGGSAPLAALLGGMLLKQLHPRPWAWPRQLGTASTLLTMLMFVLVSTTAAQAAWSSAVAVAVVTLVVARLLAKTVGVGLGNIGSGASWRQAAWVAGAMTPMSAVALLITSQFARAAPEAAQAMVGIALPAILLLELLGAVVATLALRRAGECGHPAHSPTPVAAPASTPQGD